MKPEATRFIRISRRISQETAAGRMNRSQSWISRVENGKRKLSAEEEKMLLVALQLKE
ncbi:MAG: helix-turn-helix transcriptional regulator [Thermodesulfobacteriota bacterium]